MIRKPSNRIEFLYNLVISYEFLYIRRSRLGKFCQTLKNRFQFPKERLKDHLPSLQCIG